LHLTGTVLGGNKGCSKYTGGGSTPPAITSCTDAALTGNGAAEDIYVGAADTAAKEPYTVNGNNMDQKQVVVGIRRNVVVPMLNFTFRLKTCSSMRSENN
jgi:hypothetical protein